MPLTDTAIRNARPRDKVFRLYDTDGLYLEISPRGGKWWRLKYRFEGKEKRISLGTYPEVPLKGCKDADTGEWIDGARERRDSARRLVAAGIDPSARRKAENASSAGRDSFETVAREWYAKHSPNWADGHSSKVIGRLEGHVFPWIGREPIGSITAPLLLTVLRRIESKGALETAHRVHQICGRVFRYAVATGRAERDPAGDLRGALPPFRSTRRATITDPKEIGTLLRAIDAYAGTHVVRCALKLAPLTFVRPGELRKAEWSEIDLDVAEWRIPAEKMKMGNTHIVPLSTQAISVLREIKPLTGNGTYVFPSARGRTRPMSENAVTVALRTMGYTGQQMTGHGFRAMASTLLNEQGWNRDAIERQLAHIEVNKIRAAYNYAEHLPERRRMMQAWADFLDGLRQATNVVGLRNRSGGG